MHQSGELWTKADLVIVIFITIIVSYYIYYGNIVGIHIYVLLVYIYNNI